MKCPHFIRDGKAPVTETHHHDGSIYRRRCCGFCGRYFTSIEQAPPGLKTPPRNRRVSKKSTTHLTDLPKGWF